jgi:hypothetical protein
MDAGLSLSRQLAGTRARDHEDQHLQPPQRDGVDGEAGRRRRSRRLLAQERPPRRGCATRDGIESMTAEGRPDRGCRDLHPGVAVPLGCADSPARVLPPQADDQLLDLLAEPRPPRSTTRVGPGAGDQAAVPAQQGVGPDEEARPARPRQDTADGGEQGPVGRFKLRSWSLAAEHAS